MNFNVLLSRENVLKINYLLCNLLIGCNESTKRCVVKKIALARIGNYSGNPYEKTSSCYEDLSWQKEISKQNNEQQREKKIGNKRNLLNIVSVIESSICYYNSFIARGKLTHQNYITINWYSLSRGDPIRCYIDNTCNTHDEMVDKLIEKNIKA